MDSKVRTERTSSLSLHYNVHSFLPVLLLFQYNLELIIANSLYQQYVLEHQLNLNDKI